jgi:1-acylglycerone phosphate reductase
MQAENFPKVSKRHFMLLHGTYLVPGSYYAPLNEQFKLHVSRPAGKKSSRFEPLSVFQHVTGATDRFKYAKAVVTESLKSSPRAWFWFGDSTWLVWILDTFGWRTIWVRVYITTSLYFYP